jgi:hypothetical protein
MVSHGTERAIALTSLRGWVRSEVPYTCGSIIGREVLTDYIMALLTSVVGSQERIRMSCAEQLEGFILPGMYTSFH